MGQVIRKVIAVTNRKGGVGKTSLAMLLAYGYGNRRLRTLLIDADSDQADAFWLATNARTAESGNVITSSLGFDVVWVGYAEDLPDVTHYAVVIIDGRPSGFVSGVIANAANLILAPWTDDRALDHARRLQETYGAKVVPIQNMGSNGHSVGHVVPYSDAIRNHMWNYAQDLSQTADDLLKGLR